MKKLSTIEKVNFMTEERSKEKKAQEALAAAQKKKEDEAAAQDFIDEEEINKKKKGFSKRYGGTDVMDKEQIEKLALLAGVNMAGGFDEEKFHQLLDPKLA